MRGYPLVVGAFALVIGTAGLVPVVVGAQPAVAQVSVAAADVTSAQSLYVAKCSGAGDGSRATPFCTLAEAAAAVQPGQTVLVEPGNYREALNITRSGTAGAPITFVADNRANALVRLIAPDVTVGVPISVSGAHDVVVRGFWVEPDLADAIKIDASSDVTVDQVSTIAAGAHAGVHVGESSSRVTISRSGVNDGQPGILVDPGTSAITVTGNGILARPGIVIQDSPGARITSNTLLTTCSPGIALSGASSSASLENNIVETSAGRRGQPVVCSAPSSATGISVSAGSTVQTTAAYNLIDPTSGGALYSWAGSGYSDLSAFGTASGQGSHDLAADPKLSGAGLATSWPAPYSESPAIDSADLNAPGELPTDLFGNGRANDPAVSDTGTGIGYADRGATENVGPIELGGGDLLHQAGGGPLDTIGSVVIKPKWDHTGSIGLTDFTFGTSNVHQISPETSATHTFDRAGLNCMTVWESLTNFHSSAGIGATGCKALGANYTATAPTRILDTKHAIGVKTTSPLKANGTLTLPVTRVGSLPGSQVSALVLNLSVTNPGAAGTLTVYAAGTSRPAISTLTFNAHQTRSNLVTVPLTTGISIHSSSASAVQVSADLEGYYSNSGVGFQPTKPVRVLDTRKGTGAAAHSLKSHATLDLNLSSRIPTTATAVVLTVVASGPTASGGVSVYATGKPRPAALNLSFKTKASVSNLVLARAGNGHVSLYNASAGTVQLTADLSGYFGPTASQLFVPYGQKRILDTGTDLIKAYGKGSVLPDWMDNGIEPGCFDCPLPTASVLNITVTHAKASGNIIGYPTGTRPNTSSLNFAAAQPVSNLASMIAPDLGVDTMFYNNSPGAVRIMVDEQGYYIRAE